MKPGAEGNMFVSKTILGNTPKIVPDETIEGEYGLVINGHSLVRDQSSQGISILNCITPLNLLLVSMVKGTSRNMGPYDRK